jgi:tRNA nucleotidyltransferase (CCA-adding enzyme)
MIELPKVIVHMIETIEDAGFEAYAVGGCVRDSILGRHPEDWDLTSNASRETLEALFPNAAIVNKKLGVMRITEDSITAEIAAYRIEGTYSDYRRPDTVIFTENLEEDLRRRDFTMNAIGLNPRRGLVDPYRGMEDIEARLIRGIGDPSVRFEEDALRILRAARFAAQLGFSVDPVTLGAMNEKSNLLVHISTERIREELIKTLRAPNAGNGLRILLETGAAPYLFGEACACGISEREIAALFELTDSIDRTRSEPDIRLALMYLCLGEERAYCAIDHLRYSNEMKELLRCAVGMSEKLEGTCDKTELKRLISRIGMKLYRFLAAVSGQWAETGLPERIRQGSGHEQTAAKNRELWFGEICSGGEPLFLSDMAVGGQDLLETGIAYGTEIGRILNLLLQEVLQDPSKNTKAQLLQIAADAERIQ